MKDSMEIYYNYNYAILFYFFEQQNMDVIFNVISHQRNTNFYVFFWNFVKKLQVVILYTWDTC